MSIPKIGFGTYQLLDRVAYESVACALKEGYRHIDTAKLYKNEAYVGQAIADSGISRDSLFITTKVLNKDQIKGKKRILDAFEKSLSDLKTDYVDLLLLHAPIMDKLANSWEQLEYLYNHKKCKMIGVSNFEISDLKFFEESNVIKPMVNQIELSPFYTRNELVSYCRKNNIIVEAHTSLTRGEKFNNDVLCEIAKNNKMSVPSVMLRWGLQNDYIILPRSDKPEEIRENIRVVDKVIGKEDMERLNGLNENFALTIRRN